MMFITPTPPMPSVRMPMKPSTSFNPVVIPRVISPALAEPNPRSARSSVGLKPWRFPSSSRTARSAFASIIGSTACHTSTLSHCWYQS